MCIVRVVETELQESRRAAAGAEVGTVRLLERNWGSRARSTLVIAIELFGEKTGPPVGAVGPKDGSASGCFEMPLALEQPQNNFSTGWSGHDYSTARRCSCLGR